MKYPQLVSMPSAVSDWLEERLEAHGIDGVVYTRYILSLLHSDAVDVILSDEDLQFSHLKKEVRRSSGGRKRLRRSSDWWRHAQADAEKLKRSAAVECLMSASEQTCGIESLIDELCEKLKEIESDVDKSPSEPATTTANVPELQQVSPQELAKQYYAAFPPLKRNTPNSPAKLLSFIPKWIPSPKKKNNRKSSTTNNRFTCYEDKFNRVDMDNKNQQKQQHQQQQQQQQQQRCGCCGRNNISNGKREIIGGRTVMANKMNISEGIDNWDFTYKSKTNNTWSTSAIGKCLEKTERNVVVTNDLNNFDDNNMYLEDLPVDIKELLNDDDNNDSPALHDDNNVEMMNIANMRDTGRRNFIPYGANIYNSIWSTNDANYDNRYNSVIDRCATNSILDFNFGINTITNNSKKTTTNHNNDYWGVTNANLICENQRNSMIENENNFSLFCTPANVNLSSTITNDWNYLKSNEKWSDHFINNNDDVALEDDEDDDDGVGNSDDGSEQTNQLTLSFIKLNHNKDSSPFNEVVPKSRLDSFDPFHQLKIDIPSVPLKTVDVDEKEDLLNSINSHFKPIKEIIDIRHKDGRYADGATFNISNNIDKINYKRSDSGAMYLESDYGMKKKYCEYKLNGNTKLTGVDFVLKYTVCQNDKACQTDDESSPPSSPDDIADCIGENPETVTTRNDDECNTEDNKEGKIVDDDDDDDVDDLEMPYKCTCIPKAMNKDYSIDDFVNCPLHSTRPDSTLTEITWKHNELEQCDRCTNNNHNSVMWNTDGLKNIQYDIEWNHNQNLRNIWSGQEICHACTRKNAAHPPPTLQQIRLREDIIHDGDQLLSDISSLQKSYMDELPTTEYSCDISDILVQKERKRRHSLIVADGSEGEECGGGGGRRGSCVPATAEDDNDDNDHPRRHHHNNTDDCWSFASRLEEDCLIQMSTIPTLRSVTF